MRICPLVTQTTLLEDIEGGSLVLEANENDIASEAAGEDKQEKDPFINPESSDTGADTDEQSGGEEIAGESQPGYPVRFIAKSYRGRISCLGENCRFYNMETESCRFEELIRGASTSGEDRWEKVESIDETVREMSDLHREDRKEIIESVDRMKEEIRSELEGSFSGKMEELKDILSRVTEENKMIIDSISDTLAEKTVQLEDKILEQEESRDSFRREIKQWKDSFEEGLSKNREMVDKISENYSEVVKMVENQGKTLVEKEKEKNRNEARKYNNAGVLAYHNGQYEKAENLFRKALELDSEFTEAYNNLGLTYTEIHEEDRATEAFKKAIELDPDLSTTYNNLGYAFYCLGSYQEAVEMYKEAISKSSENSSAYTNLGNAYYKLDNIDDAIEAWQRALEIDPGNEKAQRNLKRFHAETGKEN
ncbi:MAG: tetratricopeptide repeat protein [Candidatus Latescibacteria bacterium]|nr:tetratricopeptide repeat protein [bacterium]MBD3423192.1 tetratricopeptide repeat protein [Candidatus Latescibacterota bacterium]